MNKVEEKLKAGRVKRSEGGLYSEEPQRKNPGPASRRDPPPLTSGTEMAVLDYLCIFVYWQDKIHLPIYSIVHMFTSACFWQYKVLIGWLVDVPSRYSSRGPVAACHLRAGGGGVSYLLHCHKKDRIGPQEAHGDLPKGESIKTEAVWTSDLNTSK